MPISLRFDNGLLIGSWDIPSPQTHPVEFLRDANEIGFHVALSISRGAKGCFFVAVPALKTPGDIPPPDQQKVPR